MNKYSGYDKPELYEDVPKSKEVEDALKELYNKENNFWRKVKRNEKPEATAYIGTQTDLKKREVYYG